jgi:CRISPR-associated protein (TIGR02710 family)
LGIFLSSETQDAIARNLPAWRHRLETISGATVATLELVEDLLANAARRRQEQRFDAAVARIYRAFEAMSQYRLVSFGISNTAEVPQAHVPTDLRAKWIREGKCHNGCSRVALQDGFALLAALNDQLGKAFEASPLADRKRSPLNLRNNSILAHGTQPIAVEPCNTLWLHAMKLAGVLGISEAGLSQFPLLCRRAV